MRNEYCGKINKLHIGKEIKLCGWVDCFRNLGKLIFINIRDKEGIIQVFFKSNNIKIFKIASKLRNEFCVQIKGIVYSRPSKQINKNIITGEIEVLATSLNIINKSNILPIDINIKNKEEQSLKFRYLNLRKDIMIKRFKIRNKILNFVNYFMKKENFINIETPILSKLTSEGARSYLIPSRLYKNKFYALPQSPQLFKQLLMISGFDRYYQIVKCFRDEDLRSDRQPEFTQIDSEISFADEKKVKNIIERLIRSLWYEIKNINLGHFKQITYKEAIRRFGSDKPDLRNKLELIDIDNLIKKTKFRVFNNINNYKDYRIIVLHVPGGIKIKKKQINKYLEYIKTYGIKILPWIKINKCSLKNINIERSTPKFLEKKIIKKIILKIGALNKDILFFGADKNEIISNAFGALRIKIGLDLKITNTKIYIPIWINDFPMFKKNKNGKLISMHHPFTAPKNINIKILKNKPKSVMANSYDMVINGYEIGSGSVRINNSKIQKLILDILKIDKNKKNNKFKFFLNALKYGTPPHAGMALGLDRIVMLLTNTKNIKNVIAFPKNSTAIDLMTNSPDKI